MHYYSNFYCADFFSSQAVSSEQIIDRKPQLSGGVSKSSETIMAKVKARVHMGFTALAILK